MTMIAADFRVADLRSDSLFVDPSWFDNRSHVSPDRFEQVNVKECRPT